ncbi:MAG: archaeosortase/exosortase family protein [Candidatus Altiarchaeota archaeon]
MDDPKKTLKLLYGIPLLVLLGVILFGSPSRLGHLVVFLWILAGGAVFYRSRFEERGFHSGLVQKIVFLVGALAIIYSLISIPLGLSNPPISSDELAVLFSGIALVVFSVKGWSRLALPAAVPLIVVFGYQLVGDRPELVTDPLVPFTAKVSVTLINLIGISANLANNIISYDAVNGDLIRLSIIPACTGVWSMSAYLVAVLMMLVIFPHIGRKGYMLFLAGIVGTWISNLGRVLLITLSGYFYGRGGLLQIVHIHAGWIAFSIWMLVFWYVFFSLGLHEEKSERI